MPEFSMKVSVADMNLFVVIPALNEARTIGEVIDRIPRHFSGIQSVQVVIVDDGSRDETSAIAKAHGAVVVRHQANRGVGAAFRTGVEYALAHSVDVLVNMDGDGQFDPGDIAALVAPIVQNEADFVTASRFADPRFFPEGIPAMKLFGNKFYARFISSVIGRKFTDVSCGFRAYNREALLRMTLFGAFTYTQETFLDLAGKNIRMEERAVKVRGVREHGKSRVASNLFHFGFKTLSIMLRSMRDLAPFRFFGMGGLVLTLLGVLIESGMFVYWLVTKQTSPYQNLILVGAVVLLLGFLLVIVALLADMLYRQRRILEESLYYNRKKAYFSPSTESTPLDTGNPKNTAG